MSTFNQTPTLFGFKRFSIFFLLTLGIFTVSFTCFAMDLSLARTGMNCEQLVARKADPPLEAKNRLANSYAVKGEKNIVWAWLGSPTIRYPHRTLGAYSHAGSLHVLVKLKSGELKQLDYVLPLQRVFEDLTPRLLDLNDDGEDEVVLVESDAAVGAAMVVLAVRKREANGELETNFHIQEVARGPSMGLPFRWLNPVGAADFDNDGRLDLAAIHTPHIGGVLTLYHYRPPYLKAFASLTDVSNHRMGSVEQQMAVIVPPSRSQPRPTVIVPDMGLKALYALRWEAGGQWHEIARVKAMPAGIARMLPLKDGACAQLTDGSWWQVGLMH